MRMWFQNKWVCSEREAGKEWRHKDLDDEYESEKEKAEGEV